MKKSEYVQPELPNLPPRIAVEADKRVLMAMYALKSPVLRDMATSLGVPVYSVGLAVERYVEQKVIEAGLRRYGSILAPAHDRKNPILIHPKGNEWSTEPFPEPAGDKKARELLAQLPHGAYRDGMIVFRLPHAVRIPKLVDDFHVNLGARNLNQFLESDAGQARLAKADLPEDARLFTDYTSFREPSRSLASHIYVMQPQNELAVVLQALVRALVKRSH